MSNTSEKSWDSWSQNINDYNKFFICSQLIKFAWAHAISKLMMTDDKELNFLARFHILYFINF